ncbi:hypothetical protein T05_2299 [Trichinella murrelli]|uniref:Uncharacterized protein n=1 Tax=Trichinella murrelli TaxID=144512 RepID=A0A0V0T8M8_9BILA|nr:hypothetical protein T05_2299 [Trichinella murrelli]
MPKNHFLNIIALTQGEPNSASNQLMDNSQSRALLDRTQPRFKGQS